MNSGKSVMAEEFELYLVRDRQCRVASWPVATGRGVSRSVADMRTFEKFVQSPRVKLRLKSGDGDTQVPFNWLHLPNDNGRCRRGSGRNELAERIKVAQVGYARSQPRLARLYGRLEPVHHPPWK